jgi:hypothetical protein
MICKIIGSVAVAAFAFWIAPYAFAIYAVLQW